MIVTDGVESLCSFLTEHKPDFSGVSALLKSDVELPLAYLMVCMDFVYSTGIKSFVGINKTKTTLDDMFAAIIPEHSRGFATIDSSTGRYIALKGVNPYTSLDRVEQPDIPTLVEARFTRNPSNLSRYFKRLERKKEVMTAFFGKDFAYMLVLAADFPCIPELKTFADQMGKIAVVPYTSREMISACDGLRSDSFS